MSQWFCPRTSLYLNMKGMNIDKFKCNWKLINKYNYVIMNPVMRSRSVERVLARCFSAVTQIYFVQMERVII